MSEANSKEKNRRWLAPENKNSVLKAGLYLVATPIGNMGDMSFRALDTLAGVAVVYCEDTRVTGKLLKYYGLDRPMAVYNDHSDARVRSEIVKRIEDGEAIALVSDAGMPLVSDPGYKLVRNLRDADLYVSSVPGANAPLSALQLSGLPSDAFSFIGFLPSKSKARCDVLQKWKAVPSSLVAFESAGRLAGSLRDIETVLDGREVAVVREITKLYEEARCGLAGELADYYDEHGAPKGEIVLVISPPEDVVYSQSDLEMLLKEALQSMSTKDAAAFVAAQTGQPKKGLYDLALAISKAGRE